MQIYINDWNNQTAHSILCIGKLSLFGKNNREFTTQKTLQKQQGTEKTEGYRVTALDSGYLYHKP